jgi:hypothetical protein
MSAETIQAGVMIAAGLGFIVYIRWLWGLWPFRRHVDGKGAHGE